MDYCIKCSQPLFHGTIPHRCIADIPCPSCSAKDAELKRLQDELRHICGELGEFYEKQKRGSTAIEKIRFFRKDYDERIEAFRENIDSIKQGTEERMEKRDEVWRAKVGMLENDLGVAWKRIAELEIAIYAIPGTLESRGTSAAQDNLTFIRKGTTK